VQIRVSKDIGKEEEPNQYEREYVVELRRERAIARQIKKVGKRIFR
jgi:hypothetical protein